MAIEYSAEVQNLACDGYSHYGILVPISLRQSDDKAIPFNNRMTLLDYFGLNDGIDIKWAHAVNSLKELDNVLRDTDIEMLEADIVVDEDKNFPVMSHPPIYTSDITLTQWLEKVYNQSKKGLKLDFKQTKVISKSLNILKLAAMNSPNHLPVILNADILQGPNNLVSQPVNSMVFFDNCRQVTDAILSPGWTTSFVNSSSDGYTWSHVKDMYELVKDVDLFITFPVRASLVGKSKDQLMWLMDQNEKQFTLTVWTSSKDQFDLTELKFLRKYKTAVYFDLPYDQIKEIKKF